MGTLQDALLKSGLASEEQKSRRKRKDDRAGGSGKNPRARSDRRRKKEAGRRGGKSDGAKSDLERAWAARARAEKAEKEQAKQARVADQEARRRRNLELDRIVTGRVLNDDAAEVPRYFEHLGRIRRVLCTPAQRDAINRGELGIVGLRGRYLIVEPDVVAQYRRVADDLVPDLSGREPEDDGEYPPVPDDLAW
jgi:uncharacterized protein YaiL (DUF2058 family)